MINTNKRNYLVVKTLLFVVLIALAWYNRFLQDDAYISFQYAKNLVEHGRLTFNATGDFVEGYSNFLWTILMAGALKLGIKPEISSQIFSMLCWVLALQVLAKMAEKTAKNAYLSLWFMGLLGINHTFSIYATGGLETALQLYLTVLVIAHTLQLRQQLTGGKSVHKKVWVLSFIMGLGCLNRMDFILVILWSLIVVTPAFMQSGRFQVKKLMLLLGQLFSIGGSLVSLWLIWKLWYYGDIFPNTFYAKSGEIVWRRIAFYLGGFLAFYFAIPTIALLVSHSKKGKQLLRQYAIQAILLWIGIWSTYLGWVGGDFMEFRMLVPIIPFVYFIIFHYLDQVKKTHLLMGISLWMLGASIAHAQYFQTYLGIEDKARLHEVLTDKEIGFIAVGKKLGEVFSELDDLAIATVSAGAIPYFSELHTIDLLGLNDRFVAQNGRKLTDIPGHQKIAPLAYLIDRKVNLVLGNVVDKRPFETANERFQHYVERLEYGVYRMADPNEYPKAYHIIEIPMTADQQLYLWYLTPHKTIDSLIQHHHWTHQLVDANMTE